MRLSRNNRNWLALAAGWLVTAGGLLAQGELNVYSHRHYEIDQRVNALFTEKTGIAVRVVNADADQLIERLRSEGENSPADVLVTVDAGRMQRAKAQGLLQAVEAPAAAEAAPEALRDPEGFWYAYTLRARVILVAADRVAEGEITRYEDLADRKWRGRVLARSSTSSYNQALLASIIAANGERAAGEWARSVAGNMARPPQGGDRDQIKAVAAGLADVCLSNTYYFGLLLNSPDPAERAAARKIRVVFPNQGDRGTHCNVSAVGVVRHARNVEAAKAYIDFLVSDEVQEMIANGSYEYPVTMNLELAPVHREWGEFRMDETTFPKLGEHQETATRLFDAAGWR